MSSPHLRRTWLVALALACGTAPDPPGGVPAPNSEAAAGARPIAGIDLSSQTPVPPDSVGEWSRVPVVADVRVREGGSPPGVHVYRDPRLGTAYRYTLGERRLDAFVYPIGPGPPECDDACQWRFVQNDAGDFLRSLPALLQRGTYEKAEVALDTVVGLSDQGQRARMILLSVQLEGEPRTSAYLAWPFDGFVVKLRETIDPSDEHAFLPFAVAIARGMEPRFRCPLGPYEGDIRALTIVEPRSERAVHEAVGAAFDSLGYRPVYLSRDLVVSTFKTRFEAVEGDGGDDGGGNGAGDGAEDGAGDVRDGARNGAHPGLRVLVSLRRRPDGARIRTVRAEVPCRVSDDPEARDGVEAALGRAAVAELEEAIRREFEAKERAGPRDGPVDGA